MIPAPAPVFTATLVGIPGGRRGAVETVRLMRQLVNDARMDPQMLNLATSLVWLSPWQDQWHEVKSLFHFPHRQVRYMRDIVGLETLADPRITVARRTGDCDDKATLAATLFECAGYPTRFVMASYQSEDFEHVYLQVYAGDMWIDADPCFDGPLGSSQQPALKIWIEGEDG